MALAQEYGAAFPFFWDRRAPELQATESFRALIGVAPGAPLTADALCAAVHADDRARVMAVVAGLLDQGGAYEIEFRLCRGDAGIRWVLARGRMLADPDGDIWGAAGVNLDITDRKCRELVVVAHDAELTRSEAKLRTILDTMPQMVWSARPDGFVDFTNERWHAFTGVPRGPTDGNEWLGRIHPEDQALAQETWQQSLATGEPYEIEVRLRRSDGAYRWALGRALLIRDSDGAIERWFGTCTDIHDLKLAEDQLELVARELAHRIRNIFAVVNGMLMLSSRNEPEAQAFADAARGRIEALAIAHDYIRPQGTSAAPSARRSTLHGLLGKLLAPYQPAQPGAAGQPRIRITGQDIAIGTSAATSLSLVIHELATNAAKHGALSASRGTLDVVTTQDDNDVHLTWTEAGGPALAGAPAHRGFGTTLAERTLRAALGARFEANWAPSGLAVRISIARERLGR